MGTMEEDLQKAGPSKGLLKKDVRTDSEETNKNMDRLPPSTSAPLLSAIQHARVRMFACADCVLDLLFHDRWQRNRTDESRASEPLPRPFVYIFVSTVEVAASILAGAFVGDSHRER